MTLASHICPKCHEPRGESAFRRKNGKLAGWCEECRATYRDRLTRLRDSKKLIKHGIQEMATDLVAQAEGYAGHPLANLLALSHIAGAKRALAIRDGKSWRGKKAWGEYYRAQRELVSSITINAGREEMAALLDKIRVDPWYNWRDDVTTALSAAVMALRAKRDPNPEPVSSKGEDSNG